MLLLSSCATGDDAVAQGGTFDFVSPGGQTKIFYDPPSDRGTIGKLSRARSDERRSEGRLSTTSRARSSSSTSGVSGADRAVPKPTIWNRSTSRPRIRACSSSASTSGDDTKNKAQDFVVDNKVSYPSIYDPSMRSLIALGDGYPTSVIPTTIVLDRQHRVAAVFLQELLAEDLLPVVPASSSGRRAVKMTTTTTTLLAGSDTLSAGVGEAFSERGVVRSASARPRRLCARRSGVVRFTVRRAARSRLPVLPGRRRRCRRPRDHRGRGEDPDDHPEQSPEGGRCGRTVRRGLHRCVRPRDRVGIRRDLHAARQPRGPDAEWAVSSPSQWVSSSSG